MQPGHVRINVNGRGFAFLRDGSNIVLTLWEQARQRFTPASAGLHHLSFRVDSLDAVRAAEATTPAHGPACGFF